MITRFVLAPLLALSMMAPAIAQTHVVAELGTAPLLGQLDSTQTLKTDVSRNEQLFATAGSKLGLSRSEYAQLRDRIASSQVSYVTIPRHLDAMSWSSGGRVYVLHDVVIPRNTRGWEVDLHENGQVVALFIPNKCGNLSLVRKPAPVIAALPTKVEAARATPTPAPAPVAEAPAAAAPETTPPPVAAPVAALATTTPVTATTHRFPWLLLLPIIAIVGGSHGGTSVPIAGTHPPSGGPIPPPVVCPSPPPPIVCPTPH